MPNSNDAATGGAEVAYAPSVTLDVMTASQKSFNATYDDFYRINQGRVCPPDLLTTGWQTITQPIAEQLLLGKANRKLSVATIAYYSRLMMAGAWKRTGETLIISDDGVMRDAYHRCWACFLSGIPFDIFVVTGVDPAVAMDIDNGKSRTDADGLEFAGLNGLSKLIAATIKIAVRYDAGFYEPTAGRAGVKINKMSPTEVVAYTHQHSSLHDAVHGIMAEFKALLSALFPGKTDVVCFFGWRVYDLFGVDVMEDFFTELADENATGPFELLRNKLLREVDYQRRGYKPKLEKRDILAFLIKTFNAWRTGTTLRSMVLGTDEAFPAFMTPTPDDDAGEDEVGFGAPEGVAVRLVHGQADPVPA